MHSARDLANDMARTVLAQHAAVMIYTAKNQGLLENDAFRGDLSLLRTLVGPLHFEEYLKVSKRLWSLFDKSQISAYLLSVHSESRKIIKGTRTGKRAKLSQEELDERWVEASMFPPQEAQWLSDKELWGWMNQFDDMEKFSELLVELTVERGVSQTVEDLGGEITEEELLRKLREMDLTMSELRLLQLVLELIVDYSVKPIELPEDPPFILPEGVADGTS